MRSSVDDARKLYIHLNVYNVSEITLQQLTTPSFRL